MATLRVFKISLNLYVVIVDNQVYNLKYNNSLLKIEPIYKGELCDISTDTLKREIKLVKDVPEAFLRVIIPLLKSYSIYNQCKLLGIETDGHESDLYVKKTPVSEAIVGEYEYKNSVKEFHTDNDWWYEIPFAFDPFWAKKSNIK